MAEQEELQLVVSLVDDASAGLTRLRQELAQIKWTGQAAQAQFTQSAAAFAEAGKAFTQAGGAGGGVAGAIRRANRELENFGGSQTALGMERMRRILDALSKGSVKPLGDELSKVSGNFAIFSRGLGLAGVGVGAVATAFYVAN